MIIKNQVLNQESSYKIKNQVSKSRIKYHVIKNQVSKSKIKFKIKNQVSKSRIKLQNQESSIKIKN